MATDVVAAFAFGAPHTVKSNRWIAEFSLRESRRRNQAPIFTQTDIQFPEQIEVEVKYLSEEPGNPPPTLRIARWVTREAVRRGARRIVVVAAKPHLRRCIRDMEMAIREAGTRIQVVGSEEIQFIQEDDWFDPNGTQPRAASKKTWSRRERIVMLLPFFVYKCVAS